MDRNHQDYGRYVVRKLREETFREGHPFMIYQDELPDYHFYYEYLDGKIHLMYMDEHTEEFILIRELSKEEADQLRHRCKFEIIK
ncbi:hypothetical protein [Gynurincola endophyticus]|uniref:hypothetical protein n=1 Tax=Gynurincola endophyticus TaxID=2479004 RepID=UPI000F8EA631|nr:hypothetical protein [Gynurincola endophyticus]